VVDTTNEKDIPVSRLLTSQLTATQCQNGDSEVAHAHHTKGEVMHIITVGIDLAKNVFAVHGIDQQGRTALVKATTTMIYLHVLNRGGRGVISPVDRLA
jgi:hypothetical protein